MSTAPRSPATGKPMVRDTRPLTIGYNGLSARVDMPGWYCESSDESLHSGEDMKVSDAALRRLKLRADNLLAPDDIKRIRKKMKLTQREAGKIIGGGPSAFQKYERGTVTVSKAVSNLLRVLDRHPEEAVELRKFG